ncbi:MAG: DUF488 family protein [Clostridium sp.]|uniref:DUF488 domain-containing protein n=1 Tax=Clostridium sp. TaxID=1506 RepID=UPI003EE63161
MKRIIYTIGHSNYSVEKLVEMIKRYGVDTIVDARGTAYSSYNTQYNLNVITENLKKYGITYVYMGKELGAHIGQEELYINEGYMDFKKIAQSKSFRKGIERLKDGVDKGYTICILGAKQNPIECHRFSLVAEELEKEGFEVRNIMHNGEIKSNYELEEELIDRYFDRNDINFYSILDGQKNREEYLELALEKINREIGFRLEKLKEKGYKL